MNKGIRASMRAVIIFMSLIISVACSQNNASSAKAASVPEASVGQNTDPIDEGKEDCPLGVTALIEAYPDFITGYHDGMVQFKDGSEMVYDDGREKNFATILDDGDLEDMFYTSYNLPKKGESPEYLADAGRSRCEQFFKKMYGENAAAVQSKLVNVNWMGQNVKFTSVNGAAEQLKKVAAELASHPEFGKYMKSSGTFYWRPVRGAKRMSAHSYGIAFDIAVDFSDYWLWKNPKASETDRIKYANRIPHEIVEIFEKHGFIWGGAWYHYDTMHFEYRPEILKYAELLRAHPTKNVNAGVVYPCADFDL